MTEKLKKQQVLRDFKQQLQMKYGASCLDIINSEIMKLLNRKSLGKQDLQDVDKNVRIRFNKGGSVTRDETKLDIYLARDNIKIVDDQSKVAYKENSSTTKHKSKKTFSLSKSNTKVTPKSIINPISTITTTQPSQITQNLISISDKIQVEEQLDSISKVLVSQTRNGDVNKSVSLPQIGSLNHPQDYYNPSYSRFNVKHAGRDRYQEQTQTVNKSIYGDTTVSNFIESPNAKSIVSGTRNSVSLSNNKTIKDRLSVWDALRIHDAQKYQQEQQQKIQSNIYKQRQLKEYLQNQAQSKHLSSKEIQSQLKKQEYEQVMNKIREENQKEEIKLKVKKEALQKTLEINQQNKTIRDFNQNQLFNAYATQYPNDPNQGIHKLFTIEQLNNQERKKQKNDTQNLLKDLISTKQIVKKSEGEIDKQMDMHTVQHNDIKLQKSVDDYNDLVQRKGIRNQLILKAQKERTIRNYSTIEHERNRSFERQFEMQEFENKIRQEMLLDERERLFKKLHKDVQLTHLNQIEEKKFRHKEQFIVNRSIEESTIKQNMRDYYEIEQRKSQLKKQQQDSMKRDLEQLILSKKEAEKEQLLKMNPIEFQLNRRRLKELGLEKFDDQFDDSKSTSFMNKSQIL